jgi:hypothetical protein
MMPLTSPRPCESPSGSVAIGATLTPVAAATENRVRSLVVSPMSALIRPWRCRPAR